MQHSGEIILFSTTWKNGLYTCNLIFCQAASQIPDQKSCHRHSQKTSPDSADGFLFSHSKPVLLNCDCQHNQHRYQHHTSCHKRRHGTNQYNRCNHPYDCSHQALISPSMIFIQNCSIYGNIKQHQSLHGYSSSSRQYNEVSCPI